MSDKQQVHSAAKGNDDRPMEGVNISAVVADKADRLKGQHLLQKITVNDHKDTKESSAGTKEGIMSGKERNIVQDMVDPSKVEIRPD